MKQIKISYLKKTLSFQIQWAEAGATFLLNPSRVAAPGRFLSCMVLGTLFYIHKY